MKDSGRHIKRVQKKIVQAARREEASIKKVRVMPIEVIPAAMVPTQKEKEVEVWEQDSQKRGRRCNFRKQGKQGLSTFH